MKKQEERALDCSPNRGGERTVQQKVPQGLRGLESKEAVAEETVGVGRAAPIADAESVVQHMEEGVPRRHRHERPMQQRGQAGDDYTNFRRNASRELRDV